MLRIYYGRESVDKERAMFDKIAKTMELMKGINEPSRVLLLVPDQYTLQMERNAMACMNVKGLMDLEVLSFARLAEKVLNETGGSKRTPIDKHGRHMLLAKIIGDENENLSAFRNMSRSYSFIGLTNDLISEIKQHNSSPEKIGQVADDIEKDSLLKRKLKDVAIIFAKYEEYIRDKYIDTEDHLDFFISKISQSKTIKDSVLWIAGFDSFTPKVISIIKELCYHSHDVNIVMTYDSNTADGPLFQLTAEMILKLEKAIGQGMVEKKQMTGPLFKRDLSISHIEKNLFTHHIQCLDKRSESIKIIRAANIYNEIETAASFILELVRDEGLRFKDIAVICNDMEVRGAVIKRVFDEYGISYFMDQKRQALHNPAIIFITSLLDIVESSAAYEDVFRMVKTGFSEVPLDDFEDLENYAVRYRIKGKRWGSDFKYGINEYDSDTFMKINENRRVLWKFICEFEAVYKTAATAKEMTEALYKFLKEKVRLEDRLEALCKELEDALQFEIAMEMQQIWESVLVLFGQIVELVGDKKVSRQDYSNMLKAGFESIELGLIPTTTDQVVVGTMQRTRTGSIKALVVIGANDGILPAGNDDEGILNRDEKTFLHNNNIIICKDDDRRIMEERLAIYRHLSKPERYLWLGFSCADMEGKEIRPSIIVDRINSLFPHVVVEKDLRNRGDALSLIGSPESSLKHLTEALREAKEGVAGASKPDPIWQAAYEWYIKDKNNDIDLINRGLVFTNRIDNLEPMLMRKLFDYQGDDLMRISPSRLERFSRCPFAHFVQYGLFPQELRLFEVAGREAGDIYHRCLMLLTKRLTVKGLPITDEKSPWMQLSQKECYNMVDSLMVDIAAEYKEGILGSGKEEEYRGDRLKKVCKKAAWAMVEHVKQGRINEIYFEEGFGLGERRFPPIEVTAEDGVFLIEGKIDRVDILPDNYVKIIDYKSGSEKFDVKEALGGWRLQLMLYLKAAMGGMEALNREAKPAGVFYFEIKDPMVNASGYEDEILKEKVEEELRKQFKLSGIVSDSPDVIDNIAGDFTGYSDILPIRKNKDGAISYTAGNRLISESEFEDLQRSMDQVINKLCDEMTRGTIRLRPKKSGDETACRYCDYKSLCNFELSFDDCVYDVVK